MKYKTYYEKRAIWFYIAFIVSILFVIVSMIDIIIYDSRVDNYIALLTAATFGISSFVYYLYKCFRKKKIINIGNKYSARIVSAEEQVSHRTENTYYLTIEFIINGVKKTLVTDGYIGNPNEYLKSCDCAVYELNGMYIEGEFAVCKAKRDNVNIICLNEYNPYKFRKK